MTRSMKNIDHNGYDGKDVIFGKGAHGNHHFGNKRWKEMVRERLERYQLCVGNKAKTRVCQEIIREWRSKGGRFLEKNKQTGKWDDIGDRRATRKTGQRFRDQMNSDRQKLKSGDSLGSSIHTMDTEQSSLSGSRHSLDTSLHAVLNSPENIPSLSMFFAPSPRPFPPDRSSAISDPGDTNTQRIDAHLSMLPALIGPIRSSNPPATYPLRATDHIFDGADCEPLNLDTPEDLSLLSLTDRCLDLPTQTLNDQTAYFVFNTVSLSDSSNCKNFDFDDSLSIF
mmetsp:Transcript_7264/g.21056  ORF Transcript_7264/g.21056 Transcript_7264/m.21056 type:complete len:282 (+) Transcript_7264:137-982(+)